MSANPVSGSVLGSLLLTLVLGWASPASAQFPPDTLQNLKVFPRDITPRELIGIMRTFAGGLGVRCQFCHVGEEGLPLAEFDFVSDEKSTKRKARAMIEMVRVINDQHLADLEERADPPVAVTCQTCHRGVSKPRRIEDILLGEFERAGVEALTATYQELRERHYGGFAYDFSEGMLNGLAEDLLQLAMRDDREDVGEHPAARAAITTLQLNLEYHPESAFTHFGLGEAYRTVGDTVAALASYRRTLELAPEASPSQRAFVEGRIRQLEGS